jgi:hypothetical protein
MTVRLEDDALEFHGESDRRPRGVEAPTSIGMKLALEYRLR